MPLLFARPPLIPIIVRKCWISLAMVAIGNVGIDAIVLGVRNRGAAVIARIGRHFGLLKDVGGDLCGLEPYARALEHGLKQMRLLSFPMGLGVHDDLMFL